MNFQAEFMAVYLWLSVDVAIHDEANFPEEKKKEVKSVKIWEFKSSEYGPQSIKQQHLILELEMLSRLSLKTNLDRCQINHLHKNYDD